MPPEGQSWFQPGGTLHCLPKHSHRCTTSGCNLVFVFPNFKNTSVILNLRKFIPTGDFKWRLFGELPEADNDVRQTASLQILEEVGDITRESASSCDAGTRFPRILLSDPFLSSPSYLSYHYFIFCCSFVSGFSWAVSSLYLFISTPPYHVLPYPSFLYKHSGPPVFVYLSP